MVCVSKALVVLILLGILLFAGCAGSGNSQPATQPQAPTPTYACPDGTIVTSISDCPKSSPPAPAKTYACPDGTVVTVLTDCPKPVNVQIQSYICSDGTVVDDLAKCTPSRYAKYSGMTLECSPSLTLRLDNITEKQTSNGLSFVIEWTLTNTGLERAWAAEGLTLIDTKGRSYGGYSSGGIQHLGANPGMTAHAKGEINEIPMDAVITTLRLYDSSDYLYSMYPCAKREFPFN